MLESGLRCDQVAALEWQDLGVDEDDGPAVTIRPESAGVGDVVAISTRAFGDLEAIAPVSDEAGSKIFAFDANQVAIRIRAAARAAGLEHRIVAPRSRPDGHGATPSTSPSIVRARAVQWREFGSWCKARGARELPAHPATVAEYLKEMSGTRGMETIVVIRYAIRDAHRAAGHDDPCATLLVESVITDLRPRDLVFTPKMLDSDALEAIRAAAGIPPYFRGGRNPKALGPVNVALCSVLHGAQLSVKQVLGLKWRDVENLGADRARLNLRSEIDPHGSAEFRDIAGEAVRDLEAIRGDARPDDSVFGISYGGVYYRVKAAAKAAGLLRSSEACSSNPATAGHLQAATAGPSHAPTEGPPRPRLFSNRSS